MADEQQPAAHEGFAGTVSAHSLRGLVGYNMKRAFNEVQADLNRILQPFDLRMLSYAALVLIADNPGLRPSQLAAALAVERPNLVTLIEALAQRGLIKRERLASDRRAHALLATPAGRALYERAIRAVADHEARIFGTEAQSLIVALQRVEQKARAR